MRKPDLDSLGERVTRRLAGRTSRRSILSKLGAMMVAAPLLPLLPVARGAWAAEPGEAPATNPQATDFTRNAQSKDPTQCNYWRYCAIDGALCESCGGGVRTCPPGSTPAPTSWVGTCVNPDDGRSYVISYRDCCGTNMCGQGFCDNTDRESPVYRPQGNNEIIWCFGTPSMAYHCSTAVLVGLAS